MSALQRFITASAMTNLADGVAVVAWRRIRRGFASFRAEIGDSD